MGKICLLACTGVFLASTSVLGAPSLRCSFASRGAPSVETYVRVGATLTKRVYDGERRRWVSQVYRILADDALGITAAASDEVRGNSDQKGHLSYWLGAIALMYDRRTREIEEATVHTLGNGAEIRWGECSGQV